MEMTEQAGDGRMHTVQLNIDQTCAGYTVKHIALKVARLSESSFRSLKFAGGILLDGKPVRANERVRDGQALSFCFPETEGWKGSVCATRIAIVWENDCYCVIDKPAPLPTMRSARQTGDTLEDALYTQLGAPEGYLFRPVNRLDKGTSGLMVAAKNAYAQQRLQAMLHGDLFIREYVAVCDGIPQNSEGLIDLPIGKMGDSVKRCIDEGGKPARTYYRVMESGHKRSVISLRLDTGRTHQIRVHMAAIGCPVTGDYLYGTEHPMLPGRFALHSCYVRFVHPVTGETVELQSDMPKDWRNLLTE